MPTVVAALTLVGLLRFAHVDLPRWHLACGFAVLVSFALVGVAGWTQALLNGIGSFLAAWAYFVALERTDHRNARAAHYVILPLGMAALVGSRLWIDIQIYGVGF